MYSLLALPSRECQPYFRLLILVSPFFRPLPVTTLQRDALDRPAPLLRRPAWWLALAATLGVVGLAAAPPWLGAGARALVMTAFAPLCHQLPARSFAVDGVPLAVCHRCLGIYLALPLAVLAFAAVHRWGAWLGRHAGPVLVASLVPLAVDWGADALGWWANTPPSRLATGSVFGFAAGLFLARAAAALPRTAESEGRPDLRSC